MLIALLVRTAEPPVVPDIGAEQGSPFSVTMIMLFLVMAVSTFFIFRSRKNKALNSFKLDAEPMYTDEEGNTLVPEGWYPVPDGTQDRYHNGTAWTNEYRVHEGPQVVEVTDWDERLTPAEVEAYLKGGALSEIPVESAPHEPTPTPAPPATPDLEKDEA